MGWWDRAVSRKSIAVRHQDLFAAALVVATDECARAKLPRLTDEASPIRRECLASRGTGARIVGLAMMKFRYLVFASLLTLAACGNGDEGPMAGNWVQVTGTDAAGMTITFDGASNKISVHMAPRADGGHDHGEGKLTYEYVAESKALTVHAELLGHGKADTWTGTVAGDTFELAAQETKLKFKKGSAPAGH